MQPIDLEKHLEGIEPDLRLVLSAIAAACADVSTLLRTASTDSVGTVNDCGDSQIAADVAADKLVFDRLSSLAASAVSTVSSEERTEERELGGSAYSVAYDPLDGSSVAEAGWAVGAIFGVWPGRGLVGRRGDEQAAAVYAVFGPRATLVVASPRCCHRRDCAEKEEGEEKKKATELIRGDTLMVVDEFLLNSAGKWALARAGVRLDDDDDNGNDEEEAEGKRENKLPRYFAPANLRASRDNAAYKRLVLELMSPSSTEGEDEEEEEGEEKEEEEEEEKKKKKGKKKKAPATLRYTGALVADVHHILTKRNGVFLNPASESAPPKLRYLYEVAPLALVVEAAGGYAEDGDGRVLEKRATRADARCVVALGSPGGVAAAREALVEGGGSL